MGKKGFPKLQYLNLGYNAQFTGDYIKDWVTDEGFENVVSLALRGTYFTEEDLWQMIERSPWIRKLHGIDLVDNATLRRFPPNVSKLTELGKADNALINGFYQRWRGKGIFLSSLASYMEITPGYIALAKARKLDIPFS